MNPLNCPTSRKRREGFSRNLADRYSEDRWSNRFEEKEAPFQLDSPLQAELDYIPELLCVVHHGPFVHFEPGIGEKVVEVFEALAKPEAEKKPIKGDNGIARGWLWSERFLAAGPTVLLVGLYGAAAFSLLSLGPAWIGFLIGASPVAGLACWASASTS